MARHWAHMCSNEFFFKKNIYIRAIVRIPTLDLKFFFNYYKISLIAHYGSDNIGKRSLLLPLATSTPPVLRFAPSRTSPD